MRHIKPHTHHTTHDHTMHHPILTVCVPSAKLHPGPVSSRIWDNSDQVMPVQTNIGDNNTINHDYQDIETGWGWAEPRSAQTGIEVYFIYCIELITKDNLLLWLSTSTIHHWALVAESNGTPSYPHPL